MVINDIYTHFFQHYPFKENVFPPVFYLILTYENCYDGWIFVCFVVFCAILSLCTRTAIALFAKLLNECIGFSTSLSCCWMITMLGTHSVNAQNWPVWLSVVSKRPHTLLDWNVSRICGVNKIYKVLNNLVWSRTSVRCTMRFKNCRYLFYCRISEENYKFYNFFEYFWCLNRFSSN